MSLPRVLEPEVMDTPEEAVDYDAMDHRAVNALFVDHLLQASQLAGLELRSASAAGAASPLRILDVGTGTAQIPIELASRGCCAPIVAIDLAQHMLDLAARNIDAAGHSGTIRVERVDAKRLPYADGAFDVVMSNSIIHHIPVPIDSLREMVRVLRPGGLLFVRDLMRPNDAETVEQIVARYAGDSNAHQQRMFRESLHAALTVVEIRTLLESLNLPADCAAASSDRHWTVAWKR